MHWKFKVAELPPNHVLLSSDLPVNVCTCRYHQYFMLFWEAMHKIQSDFHLYSHDLPPSLVCNKNSDDCWNNKYDECTGGKGFMEKFPLFDTSVKVKWYRWEKKLMGSGKERLQKVQKSGKLMFFTMTKHKWCHDSYSIFLLSKSKVIPT